MVRLRVKELAEERNIKTQRELAKLSGSSVQVVNRYWNSNVQRADFIELERLAVALKVRVGDLFISDRDPIKAET